MASKSTKRTMTLTAWEELAPEPLAFPIGGRTYVVKPLSYRDGQRLQHLLDDPKAREGLTDEDLWRLGLGPTFEQMIDDGATPAAIERAGMAAITDYKYGREAALTVWATGWGDLPHPA